MSNIPRSIGAAVPGFRVIDMKEFIKDMRVDIYLEREEGASMHCFRCDTEMEVLRGKHRMQIESMPIMGFPGFFHFWRRKGHCSKCKKARSEKSEFISYETPHLHQEYAWWIGRICEIAPVSRVGELVGQDGYTTWRLDFARMRRMLQHYRIPSVTGISVDEVYARKKAKFPRESRDRKFFTVITDLRTHRVVWVSEGREKEALDEFFRIIGEEASKRIRVVAMDQHEPYMASVKEHCQKAEIVWDKFHILKNFEEAVNSQRMWLHERADKGSELQRLTRGKFKYIFLKKKETRTEEERSHIDTVLKINEKFAKLEIIKERMLTFFYQSSWSEAKKVFEEVGDWIAQADFGFLWEWHNRLEAGLGTLKNYFRYRVTSALSEGINNVIKVIKRRAYGYRNMAYFKLKIMQVCGFLNSRFIPTVNSMTCTNLR